MVLFEKPPSVKSLREHLGEGGNYCMYYIEGDIAENTDCFSEFVDIQREINALMEAGKADECYNDFIGHFEIIAVSRKLRAFYLHGSITKELWADDIISGKYKIGPHNNAVRFWFIPKP